MADIRERYLRAEGKVKTMIANGEPCGYCGNPADVASTLDTIIIQGKAPITCRFTCKACADAMTANRKAINSEAIREMCKAS